jgi:hypothetical protein
LTKLDAYGITADLPPGFEGRIFRRTPAPGERTYAVAQFATFALPPTVADFGNGAVELMSATDIFAVLFEYGPESAHNSLFRVPTIPRRLAGDHFVPTVLRRALPGQSGTQWFFTESSRPFTLYAVLGSHRARATLVPSINTLLAGISIKSGAT